MQSTRHVFDSSMVAHVWAAESQDNGRNPQDNFYFRGRTIYSYRDSFPIAAIHHRKGSRCTLVTTATYSNTTAGHISDARRACSGTVFSVPEVNPDCANDHKKNLADYRQRIADTMGRANRSHKYRDSLLSNALHLAIDHNAYADFFGLRVKRLPEDLETLASTMAVVIKRERVKTAAEAKRTAKLVAKRQAEYAAAAQVKLTEWCGDPEVKYAEGKVYLRIVPSGLADDDRVIATTLGATISLDHAIRALPLIRRCQVNGEAWETNGHTVHLGHFKIDRIDRDGTVYAGCHTVTFDEIARIARQLGL